MQEVFKAAEAIIRDTGIWIKSSRKARGSGTIEVKGANDFVTQTDLEAEQKLVAGLSPLIRNAGFLTEEGSIAESDSPTYRWIIDPIDGTTNFIHDLPCYSVSVGLEKFTNGIPDLIWGMVYEIS
ncbi:MAG: myo-inositol-1(or 4)-monophosphatase, partial [Limisphaerales bacterium]